MISRVVVSDIDQGQIQKKLEYNTPVYNRIEYTCAYNIIQ